MRILYGLCGDGLGHAMRARVVAAHLLAEGHEVRMASSGRAAALLRRHGFTVVDVRGLTAHYEGGRLCRGKTMLRAVKETPARLGGNARAFVEQAAPFAPDAVLTDFNGFACAIGHALNVPTVSLDHQHVLDRFHHPWRVVGDFAVDFALARAVVSAKTPYCHRYLVTSFFFPQAYAEHATSILGPVMRPEVERLTPTRGDHVVVYQTAGGDAGLVSALRCVDGVPFHVYGHGEPGRVGNVELFGFDEKVSSGLLIGLGLFLGNPWLLVAAPLTNHLIAQASHRAFEKNRTLPWKNTLWHTRAELRMWKLVLTGRMGSEVRRWS